MGLGGYYIGRVLGVRVKDASKHTGFQKITKLWKEKHTQDVDKQENYEKLVWEMSCNANIIL